MKISSKLFIFGKFFLFYHFLRANHLMTQMRQRQTIFLSWDFLELLNTWANPQGHRRIMKTQYTCISNLHIHIYKIYRHIYYIYALKKIYIYKLKDDSVLKYVYVYYELVEKRGFSVLVVYFVVRYGTTRRSKVPSGRFPYPPLRDNV